MNCRLAKIFKRLNETICNSLTVLITGLMLGGDILHPVCVCVLAELILDKTSADDRIMKTTTCNLMRKTSHQSTLAAVPSAVFAGGRVQILFPISGGGKT